MQQKRLVLFGTSIMTLFNYKYKRCQMKPHLELTIRMKKKFLQSQKR